MQIIEITYEELVNTGNYENVKLGMTATVSETEDIEMATTKLVRKVRRNLKDVIDNGGKVHG